MNNSSNDFVKIIEFIIYSIEKHTITKPEDESEKTVVEVYKALYGLKDYFESQQD